MKTVILCGGQGTRLREQTEVLPKPMVDIGGRPILWHIMKLYAHFGLTDFVLCLGYKGEIIRDYFAELPSASSGDESPAVSQIRGGEVGWNVSMVDTGEKAMTGARLFRVRDYVGTEPFCLTYGDGVCNVNIADLIQFHRSHGKMVTVTGVHPAARFGELELEGDRVRAFAEKPQVTESFINGGFFVIEPQFFERYLRDDDELSLEREPLRRAAADGEMMMFPHTDFWQCMDTYREWKILEEMWNAGTAPWRVW